MNNENLLKSPTLDFGNDVLPVRVSRNTMSFLKSSRPQLFKTTARKYLPQVYFSSSQQLLLPHQFLMQDVDLDCYCNEHKTKDNPTCRYRCLEPISIGSTTKFQNGLHHIFLYSFSCLKDSLPKCCTDQMLIRKKILSYQPRQHLDSKGNA